MEAADDAFPSPIGRSSLLHHQPSTYLCLMELPRSLRGICGDQRGTESVSVGTRTDRKVKGRAISAWVLGIKRSPNVSSLASERFPVASACRAIVGAQFGSRETPQAGPQQMLSNMSAEVGCVEAYQSVSTQAEAGGPRVLAANFHTYAHIHTHN